MEKVLEVFEVLGLEAPLIQPIEGYSLIEVNGKQGSVSALAAAGELPISIFRELIEQLMTFDAEETFIILSDEDSSSASGFEPDLEVLEADALFFQNIAEKLIKELGLEWSEEEEALEF